MFAVAMYDEAEQALLLARDRLGEKPLWYAVLEDRIVFASEAKALLAHPRLRRQADPQSAAFYLTLGYVPAPRSIWQGVLKLPPAHYLLMRVGKAGKESGVTHPTNYWSPPTTTVELSHDEAVDRIRELVASAVASRLVADVPLGALLSGGVDSSIIVALMTKSAGRVGGVKTFTAGFADALFDERPHARLVAQHLGADHHELDVQASDVPALLDQLVRQYDEPFADSSALPTYLICQAAARHVKVCLTGDGGDEAFGGYDRYRAMHLAGRLGGLSWAAIRVAAMFAGLVAPRDERSALRRFVRFANNLDDVPAEQYFNYRRLFSPGNLSALMERDFASAALLEQPREWFTQLYEQADFADELAYAQRHDVLTYLPDDLLVKADIASMANSLELRPPMLDHRVVALGLTLPAGLKVRGLRGKVILRDAFGHLLPRQVFARPKRGFGAPIDSWLRNELSGRLKKTLLDGPLVQRDWLARTALEQLIQEHFSGRADHRHRLWALLWLGRWLELTG
jgi:asparagine synthase (glutamine-hydrolysing)